MVMTAGMPTPSPQQSVTSSRPPRRRDDSPIWRTHCRTDDALKRRLQETVRNHFADNGRRTPVGRLVLRINEVLANRARLRASRALLVVEGVHR